MFHTSKSKNYNIPKVYEYCKGKLKKNEKDTEIGYLLADKICRTF